MTSIADVQLLLGIRAPLDECRIDLLIVHANTVTPLQPTARAICASRSLGRAVLARERSDRIPKRSVLRPLRGLTLTSFAMHRPSGDCVAWSLRSAATVSFGRLRRPHASALADARNHRPPKGTLTSFARNRPSYP